MSANHERFDYGDFLDAQQEANREAIEQLEEELILGIQATFAPGYWFATGEAWQCLPEVSIDALNRLIGGMVKKGKLARRTNSEHDNLNRWWPEYRVLPEAPDED